MLSSGADSRGMGARAFLLQRLPSFALGRCGLKVEEFSWQRGERDIDLPLCFDVQLLQSANCLGLNCPVAVSQ